MSGQHLVEKGLGTLLPGEYDFRSDAISAAWSDAFKSGRETEAQMLAVMMRPPRGYAVVLVSGVAEFGPSRLGSWDEVARLSSTHTIRGTTKGQTEGVVLLASECAQANDKTVHGKGWSSIEIVDMFFDPLDEPVTVKIGDRVKQFTVVDFEPVYDDEDDDAVVVYLRREGMNP